MARYRNIAEWRGTDLVDRDGDKIGKLEDVYVDVESGQGRSRDRARRRRALAARRVGPLPPEQPWTSV